MDNGSLHLLAYNYAEDKISNLSIEEVEKYKDTRTDELMFIFIKEFKKKFFETQMINNSFKIDVIGNS